MGVLPQSVAILDPAIGTSLGVGLWVVAGKRSIGLFHAGEQSDATVVPLLHSDLALRDITYFPDPDTPSGVVTVLRDVDERTVEVLGGKLDH